MPTISYTEVRDRLASVWDEMVSTREPVTIDRRGHESVVLVPASEWQGLGKLLISSAPPPMHGAC